MFSCEFWEISKNNFFHRKNLWNIIWWSQFLQLNFIKDFKSSFSSLLWNTIWNNWIIYYVSYARKLSITPVNNCILEYVKKDKGRFADFFYLASETWIVCRILLKVKNELKIHIIYIGDFGTDISISQVWKIYKFDFKGHFETHPKSYQ